MCLSLGQTDFSSKRGENLRGHISYLMSSTTIFSLNRFDKRQIASATRTWVATQHVKLQDRPLLPIHDREVAEQQEDDGAENRLVPYDQPNQRTRPHFGTPALQYNPTNQRGPYLSEFASRQGVTNTGPVIGQAEQPDRHRILRSDTVGASSVREAWGRPIEFDCKKFLHGS